MPSLVYRFHEPMAQPVVVSESSSRFSIKFTFSIFWIFSLLDSKNTFHRMKVTLSLFVVTCLLVIGPSFITTNTTCSKLFVLSNFSTSAKALFGIRVTFLFLPLYDSWTDSSINFPCFVRVIPSPFTLPCIVVFWVFKA